MSVMAMGCPSCGGALEVQEGRRLAKCAYCDKGALVVGDEGVVRAQVHGQLDKGGAEAAVRGFFKGLNRARDLPRRAVIKELLPVWLPFWRVHGHVAGVVLGEKKVGSGDYQHYKPHEDLISQDMVHVLPACDVGEFGVQRVDLSDVQALEPYDSDALHKHGMVFEPTQTRAQGLGAATEGLRDRVVEGSDVERVSSHCIEVLHPQATIVQYPLWIGRYTYKKRLYQVTVDGVTGEVLYGRAPGSLGYRVVMLALGAAFGTVLMVSGPLVFGAGVLVAEADAEALLAAIGCPVVMGPVIIAGGYAIFRWGGEVRVGKGKGS